MQLLWNFLLSYYFLCSNQESVCLLQARLLQATKLSKIKYPHSSLTVWCQLYRLVYPRIANLQARSTIAFIPCIVYNIFESLNSPDFPYLEIIIGNIWL